MAIAPAAASRTDAQEPRGLWGPAARTRLIAALTAWCIGSLIGWTLPSIDAWLWLLGSLAALAGAIFATLRARARLASALFLLTALFISAAWSHTRLHRLPASDLRVLTPTQSLLRVRGQITQPPSLTPPPRGTLAAFRFASADRSLTLDLISVDQPQAAQTQSQLPAVPASGTLRVIFDGPEPLGLQPGEIIELTGLFRPALRQSTTTNTNTAPPRDPSYCGTLAIRDRASVRSITPSLPQRAIGLWLEVRAAAIARCEAALDAALPKTGDADDAECRALMMDLVLGRDTPSNQPGADVGPTFTRLGLAHALSISGFHLSIMAWLALQLLRLTGERGRLESVIVITLVLLYMFVVPSSSPVIRAGLLTIAVLLGEALGRRYDRVTLLAWAAWLILVFSPRDLWSIGFQLTFALTASLVWLARAAQDRIFGERLFRPTQDTWHGVWPFLRDKSREAISTSLLCWAVGTPIIMAAVGIINPWAAIAGLLVGLPLTLALILGYITLVIGIISPAAAALIAAPLALTARFTISIASWMDTWPLTVIRVPPVPVAWALVASIASAWWFSRGSKHSRGILAILTVLLGLWLGSHWLAIAYTQRSIPFRIDALAVPNGSSVLLRSDGESILFDAGGTADVGLRRVPDACRALGAWSIPLIIASGPTTATVLGAPDAADMLSARSFAIPVWAPAAARRDPQMLWGALTRHLDARGIITYAVAAGDTITLGRCTLRVLTPAPTDPHTPISLLIETANTRVLLLGRPTDEQLDAIANAAIAADLVGSINLIVSGAADSLNTRLAKRLRVVRVLHTHDLDAFESFEPGR